MTLPANHRGHYSCSTLSAAISLKHSIDKNQKKNGTPNLVNHYSHYVLSLFEAMLVMTELVVSVCDSVDELVVIVSDVVMELVTVAVVTELVVTVCAVVVLSSCGMGAL